MHTFHYVYRLEDPTTSSLHLQDNSDLFCAASIIDTVARQVGLLRGLDPID